MATSDDTTVSNYLKDNLPPHVVQQLEAGAFRSLCTHLSERSDQVSNMELMTLSGFCRNCLAKWLVMEARNLDGVHDETIQNALDAVGYDEAAEYVYGCDYKDWKKRHMTKATDEQMQRFNDSKPLWAKHDKELLKPRRIIEKETLKTNHSKTMTTTTPPSSLLSNVCCQNVDEMKPAVQESSPPVPSSARSVTSIPTPDPPRGGLEFTVCILTVSDRAAKQEYATGDLSGPAVQQSLEDTCRQLNQNNNNVNSVSYKLAQTAIVPDVKADIQTKLQEWSSNKVDLILTTGGTGFGVRDVTPEATEEVLTRSCPGLMQFVLTECSLNQQPLASLSRGLVGIRDCTLICNLPGNPKGVLEVVPVLLPLVLHPIKDLQQNQ